MFWQTPRRRLVFWCGIAYIMSGVLLTLMWGGLFCSGITRKSRESMALSQEFLRGRSPVPHLPPAVGPVLPQSWPQSVGAVPFDGIMLFNTHGEPSDLWIAPFAVEGDAVHIHFNTNISASAEYCKNKPLGISGQTVRLIFIDECWPRQRLRKELAAIDESDVFSFYACPAEPPEHNRTITIYGLGRWADYSATVTNAEDFPNVRRSLVRLSANSLNYIWAFPLDVLLAPVYYIVLSAIFWAVGRAGS